MHKLKLSFGDTLLLKKYYTQCSFDREIESGIEKYQGIGNFEWRKFMVTFSKSLYWKDYLEGEKSQSIYLSEIIKQKKMQTIVTDRILMIFDDCFEKIDSDKIQKILNKVDKTVKVILVLKDASYIHSDILSKTRRISFEWITSYFKNQILKIKS